MSKPLRLLYITERGDIDLREVTPTLDVMQGLIGGWIEAFSGSVGSVYGHWTGFCDEEGKLKQLPVNGVATAIAHAIGWTTSDVLCGPVIFMGPPDEDGYETDVPVWLVDLVRAIRA